MHDSFDSSSFTIGDCGEIVTANELRSLGFSVVRGIYLSIEDVDVQIDMVLISGDTLYVIENKNYNAEIIGTVEDTFWVAKYESKDYSLLNPILQNSIHCQVLSHFFPKYTISNIVVFNNKAVLRNNIDNVFKLSDFKEYMKDKRKDYATDVYKKLLDFSDTSESKCKEYVNKKFFGDKI